MRLVSGGENGQAFLWDLNGERPNEKYDKAYQIATDDVSTTIKSDTSRRDISCNGWASMTWSSDGNCLASAREHSEGLVTLTHIKKVQI